MTGVFNFQSFNFTYFNKINYSDEDLRSWFADAKNMGANAATIDWCVAVDPKSGGLMGKFSSNANLDLGGIYQADFADLTRFVSAAGNAGLEIYLKPHFADGSANQPTHINDYYIDLSALNKAAFFSSFKQYMSQVASFAQASGVKGVVIGTENSGLDSDASLRAYWTDAIDTIRSSYSGILTYSPTGWIGSRNLNGPDDVVFWDKLDLIGSSFYYKMADNPDGKYDDFVSAWFNNHSVPGYQANLINEYKALSIAYGKPVAFLEIGYPSWDGVATSPSAINNAAAIDLVEQENLVKAAFDVLSNHMGTWFYGLSWWSSPYLKTMKEGHDNGYMHDNTFPGKPAEAVVDAWFSGQQQIAGLSFAGTATNDTLDGGWNADRISGENGADLLRGGNGGDTISGGAGGDTLYGNFGEDFLSGDDGDDTLFGGQGADIVSGGTGNDVLYGNMASDQIFGGTGADTIFGGQGGDLIIGGAANDVLSGNLGADTFVFNVDEGADQILGFSSEQGDQLNFSGQTYSIGAGADGSLVLILSGGGGVTLVGIAPTAFNPAWVTA